MDNKKLEETLENLKSQQEQSKEIHIKCQGAIEIIQALLEEENKSEDSKKEKKDKK